MARTRRLRNFLAGGILCCAMSAPALAQAPGPGGRIIYDAPYFSTFSPANALQIVQRVPGFALQVGDQEVRGFGQAAGNVVINGQRPSSKSDTLETILARIPASRVARVEVGSGDLFGSEYSGKPQVLNLVLTGAAGLAGTLTGSVRRDFTGKLFPEGSASALVRRGPSTFNVSAGINNSRTSEEGFDRLLELPSGEELEFRRKFNRIKDPNGYVSGSWEYNGGENRTAHLNGRFALDRFSLTQDNQVFPAVGPERNDFLTQRSRRRDVEIGGDVTRPLAGGGLKLIGLATRRHRTNRDASLIRVASDTIGGFRQDLEDFRDETLLRLVWNRANLAGWNFETGAEGVLNRLDSDVNLFVFDDDGGETRIDLPVDQAVVEEYRGEAFINAGRSLARNLRMDLGLTYEISRLTVSGDAEAERVLRFLKPKATLDWRGPGGWRAQFSVQRTVAQLQFEDFISSAELTNDRVNGGNADLLPQRAWEFLFTAERPILGDGLVKIDVGYNQISLVQDRIPTPEGFDAPGNLGDGKLFLVRGRIDAPLGRFGIKGGRLTLYASYVKTSVEDPYTGRLRRFSGNSPFVGEASFRQDLGKFAWGFGLNGSAPSTFFRLNEEDQFYSDWPYVTAFAEYRPTPKTTLTLGVNNLTGIPAFRERTFFFPNRSDQTPDRFEFRHRNQHIVPYLTLKHSFG